MNRRDFLKVGGVLSTAALVAINPVGSLARLPVEIRQQGKVYRGTPDGRFYVSSDDGKSWKLHTNFGVEFSFLALNAYHSGLQAQLEFKGNTFELALGKQDNIWRTV
jgi:hypothetical protein